MSAPEVLAVLKRDAFGRVELLGRGGERRVRRVACGGRLPFSRWIARALLAREARALSALAGSRGVPELELDPSWAGGDAREVLVRAYVRGEALHRAETLPRDFFERLAELVREVHARGVCHNDLHKEQNVVVGEDGRPHVIDFQLASLHRSRSAVFDSRARDDLRHVAKHLRRYTRLGRGPEGAPPAAPASLRRLPRSLVAAAWRRTAKPLYNALTRGLLGTRDGEERRASSGPWPRWTAPIGAEPEQLLHDSPDALRAPSLPGES